MSRPLQSLFNRLFSTSSTAISTSPATVISHLFSPRSLLRNPQRYTGIPSRSFNSHASPRHIRSPLRNRNRYQSTRPSSSSTSSSTRKTDTYSRLDRLLNRLPRFLHPYTTNLRSAPVSHIIAFLILHELTAIIPLFGLTALFHYADWIPGVGGSVGEEGYVSEGVERFGRYFRRKGWFGFGEGDGEDFFGGAAEGAGIEVDLITACVFEK